MVVVTTASENTTEKLASVIPLQMNLFTERTYGMVSDVHTTQQVLRV